MRRFYYCLLALIAAASTVARAQDVCPPDYENLPEQDCINAIELCEPFNEIPNGAICGAGANSTEINVAATCFGSAGTGIGGERQTTWYRFRIRNNGTLSFLIIPNDVDTNTYNPAVDGGTTSIGSTDYDWILYDLTNHTCADIYSNPEINAGARCDWSGTRGPTGLLGNSTAGRLEPVLPVFAGQEFVLAVDNFSETQIGYFIDFRLSTAEITPEPEQIPLQAATDAACPGRTLTLEFEQDILCSSFTPEKIRIESIDPATVDSTYEIISVEAVSGCDQFGYASSFDVTFTQFQPTANHQIIVQDTIFGECASFVIDDTLRFSIPEFVNLDPVASSDTVPCSTPVTLDANPILDGEFIYTWLGPNLETNDSRTVTAFPETDTVYTVIAQLADGSCADTASIPIFIDSFSNLAPIISDGADTVCAGTTVRLDANPLDPRDYSYFWEGDGVTDPQVANPLVTPTQTTTYTVFAQLADGTCPDSASVTVFVRDAPDFVELSDSVRACDGEPITLTAFHPDVFIYTWEPLNGGTPFTTTNSTVEVTPLSDIRYIVRGETAEVCDIVDTITVTVQPTGTFDQTSWGPDRTVLLCGGDTAALSAIEFDGLADDYQWFSLGTTLPLEGVIDATVKRDTIFVRPETTTQYVVRAFSETDCRLTDTVTVVVQPNDDFGPIQDVYNICTGDEAVLTVPDLDILTYVWRALGDDPGAGIISSTVTSELVVAPTEDTEYEVRAILPNICPQIDTLLVRVGTPPSASFALDRDFAAPPLTVNLTNTSVSQLLLTYSWAFVFEGDTVFFSETPDAASLEVTEAFPDGAYELYLIAADPATGCETFSEAQVLTVEGLRLPNVITPNNDGRNDALTLRGIRDLNNVSLRVFNRYGQEVYETDAYNNDWRADDLTDGTYFYWVRDRETNQEYRSPLLIVR